MLKKAKESESDLYFVEPTPNKEAEADRIQAQDDIQKAILNEDFIVYTQSVRAANQELQKECYIRLKTSTGEIPASLFLPVAEELGIEDKVDYFMLNKLFEQSDSKTVFAINLSSTVIVDEDKKQPFIKKLLDKKESERAYFNFEINENILAHHKKQTLTFIHDLNRMGYTVGLDHVGSALLSFDYLKNSKVQYLKLDGAFSRGLTNSQYKKQMIQNLISLCENLDIQVIATMVENKRECEHLKALNVHWLQGDYISRQKPLDYTDK